MMENYNDYGSPYESAVLAVATGTAEAPVPTRTTILTYQVKNGKRGFLRAVRNTISAGGGDLVAFSVLLNGNALENFDRIKNQIAAPEDQKGNLLFRLPLPQGSTLSVVADNYDTANTYVGTAKLEIGYESI